MEFAQGRLAPEILPLVLHELLFDVILLELDAECSKLDY